MVAKLMINQWLLIIGKMKKVVFLILTKVMIYGSLLKMCVGDFCHKITLTNGAAKAKELIKKVNREDIWKEAAKELGIPAADIPTSTSRGVEEFFDGIKFDPEKPEEYLKSLKIKKS